MVDIGSYRVQVLTQAAGSQDAVPSPARAEDMPNNWTGNWQNFWQNTDFDQGKIIKLECDGQVWGLIRYILYPYPESPETLEIENLEANPINTSIQVKRLVEPIGKWLIWYATQVGLRCCSGGESDTPIFLASLGSAVDYYRDIIEMEYVGATNLAPGEDGYVFKFSRENAATFCRRQEEQWGVPTHLNP